MTANNAYSVLFGSVCEQLLKPLTEIVVQRYMYLRLEPIICSLIEHLRAISSDLGLAVLPVDIHEMTADKCKLVNKK